MLKPGFLLVLLSILYLSAQYLSAQDTPKVELFGGYALARIDDTNGLSEQHITQMGWNASAAANFNRYLGAVADFGGYYGTHRLPPFTALTCPTCPMTTPSPFQADTKYHTFLFGPQFSLRLEHLTPFVHTLFGIAHEHAELVPATPGVTSSETGFSFAVGGGLDANIASHLAFRLQGDYLHSSLFGPLQSQNNARFSTGLVLRFGD